MITVSGCIPQMVMLQFELVFHEIEKVFDPSLLAENLLLSDFVQNFEYDICAYSCDSAFSLPIK